MENIPEQIEYQGNQRQLRRLLRYLRQTRKHVIVLAGMRIQDKTEKHVIDVSPKAQAILGKWPHVVGELVQDVFDELGPDPHAVLFTQPSRTRQAKSRFAELRPNVVDPTFDTLWQPIKDKLPEADEADDGLSEKEGN
jgi:hypothetical protein